MSTTDPKTDPPNPSLRQRSSAGVIWSTIDSVGQQILSLLIFIVLGRLLTPEIFGIVSTSLVFVYLMRSTILNAVSTSLVTQARPSDEDYDTAFWLLVAISGTSFIILNAAAAPLARAYDLSELEYAIRGTSVMVVLIGLSYAHIGWARKNFRFRSLAIRNISGVLAGGCAGIALAVAGHGMDALIANQVVMALLSLVLLWIMIPWRPRLRTSGAAARRILGTAIPLGVSQGLLFLVQNFDTAVVTFLLGPVAGGLYAVAKRITLAVYLAVWHPVGTVAQPAFTEVMGDKARFSRLFVMTCSLLMAVTVPIYAAIGMAAPELIELLFGDHWLAAAPVLSILCVAGILLPITGLLHVIIIAHRKSNWILAFTVVQIVLALGALWLVAPQTTEAIAICLTAPYAVTYLLSYLAAARLVAFRRWAYAWGLLKPLAAGVVMALAMSQVPALGKGLVLDLCAHLAVGGVVYAAVMALIARDTLREISSLLQAAIKRRSRS